MDLGLLVHCEHKNVLKPVDADSVYALILDVGGLRRTWLRGVDNVEKRYLIQVAAYNLGLVIRRRFGAGTPRQAMEVACFVSCESGMEGAAIWATLCVVNRAGADVTPSWAVVTVWAGVSST